MPEAQPEWIKAEAYIEFFDWLHELSLSDEYAAALKAYRLVSPETWAQYDAYEMTGLKEQQLLEAAAVKLRKRWKLNRPSFLGRKFKSHEEQVTESESPETNPESVCQRPEDATVQRRRRNRKRRLPREERGDPTSGVHKD